MFTRTKRPLVALVASSALALGMAAPASAQTQQEGLVNVSLTDTTVQVPIGIAANICNVNVAALTGPVADLSDECDAATRSNAKKNGGSGGSTKQNGLVNVSLTDTTIQVPIGIAANVCNVNVAVLTSGALDTSDECEAVSEVGAEE